MITLTEEQAQQIEETLVLICKAHPEVNGGFLVNMALDNIRAARAQEQAEQEPVAWRVRGYNQFKTGNPAPWRYVDGTDKPTVNIPDCCDFEPLYAAPVQQAEQEPVANQYNGDDGPGFDKEFHAKLLAGAHLLNDEGRETFNMGWNAAKEFFTAPIRTKDLTDEEIAQAVGSPLDEVYLADFRAVIAKFKEKNK